MVFSSPLFIFLFLPLTLLVFHCTGQRIRQLSLLLFSLLFYLVGSGAYILVLLASIVVNFSLGLAIERIQKGKKILLLTGCVANLIPLLVYKYAGFVSTTANQLAALVGTDALLPVLTLFLPAGISFFTFQGLAYLVDVFHGEMRAERSLLSFALFKSFFPQLIAGPIVRYQQIRSELDCKRPSYTLFEDGLIRFGMGLGRKVLLADTLGQVADSLFGLQPSELTASLAWLGIVSYSLQIYFDFSGYSDMAIGIAKMFGLTLPENFNHPYTSTSVTEFWRRWHISLSSWFRDYLYIPMGGNRGGLAKTCLNLLVVFSLCGLWHGASLNFLAWGLWHGAALILERFANKLLNFEPHGIVGFVWTQTIILFGWVLFRATDLAHAREFLTALVGLGSTSPIHFGLRYYLTPYFLFFLAIGLLFAFAGRHSWVANMRMLISKRAMVAAALVLLALSITYQAPRSFNPFIYFQF